MVGFLSRNDRKICDQKEMDPEVEHQVSLEFCQVNVQSHIKSEGSNNGRHNLANKMVKISVGWVLNIKVSMTDIVDSLIAYHEDIIRVLQTGVSGEDGIVRFNGIGRKLQGRAR